MLIGTAVYFYRRHSIFLGGTNEPRGFYQLHMFIHNPHIFQYISYVHSYISFIYFILNHMFHHHNPHFSSFFPQPSWGAFRRRSSRGTDGRSWRRWVQPWRAPPLWLDAKGPKGAQGAWVKNWGKSGEIQMKITNSNWISEFLMGKNWERSNEEIWGDHGERTNNIWDLTWFNHQCVPILRGNMTSWGISNTYSTFVRSIFSDCKPYLGI